MYCRIAVSLGRTHFHSRKNPITAARPTNCLYYYSACCALIKCVTVECNTHVPHIGYNVDSIYSV